MGQHGIEQLRIVRASTLRGLKARLIVGVSCAALLSAASFQAAWAQTAKPNLLTAGSFAVLGASTVTNAGATFVTGDLGVSPGAAITGFDPFPANVLVNVPPGTVSAGGGRVTGGSIHAGGIVAAQAHADAAVTYLDLQGRVCPAANTFGAVAQLGGLTLAPGVYCFPTSANVTGTLTLAGGPDDVWIFQIGSTLVTGLSSHVVMTGGAKATNVWWAVGSSATLDIGTEFSGNILASASITLNTNARVFGRALALNGAVTMLANNVSAVCAAAPCSRTLGDFNGDGRSDVLWRNSSTGESYIYPMNGTAILATEGYLRTVADPNWRIVGRGDFDGDGKADVLWRNTSTGENYVYFMDGTAIKATEGYVRTVMDQNWQVAGIGDFDGDGKDDILWRNSTSGENYIYLMDGTTIKPSEGYLRTVSDVAWQIVGVGDFDGDGKADILWRNSVSGQNYVYPMGGTTILAGEGYLRTVADQNWQVAGVGDFDGDGKADILWRNGSSGENYLYPMDGTAIKPGEGYVRMVADLAWQIVAMGDFDGDGKADLFWRNGSSGENYLYPMDGTTIKPSEGYLRTVGDQNWKPQR